METSLRRGHEHHMFTYQPAKISEEVKFLLGGCNILNINNQFKRNHKISTEQEMNTLKNQARTIIKYMFTMMGGILKYDILEAVREPCQIGFVRNAFFIHFGKENGIFYNNIIMNGDNIKNWYQNQFPYIKYNGFSGEYSQKPKRKQ